MIIRWHDVTRCFLMKRILWMLGTLFMLSLVIHGCGDDDDTNPTTPTNLITYRVEVTGTPVSGDCEGVPRSNSGTVVLESSGDSFTIVSCEFHSGATCEPSAADVTLEGQQVTLQGQSTLPNGEPGQFSVTGTVTDPSLFTLSGQATIDTCVLGLTITFTQQNPPM